MLGEPQAAEDAAQETFLKAHRNLRRYDPKRPFVNWILGIASNHCVDRIRRRRLQLVSYDEMPPTLDLSDDAAGPEAALVSSEQQGRVRGLLDALGSKDRAAVILFYWYDMSYQEIADTLSLTLSAVKSRLHRARKAMAQEWLSGSIKTNSMREVQDEPSTL
jgi:RNA polymerase sigma-70 factor (ECF subfamily)